MLVLTINLTILPGNYEISVDQFVRQTFWFAVGSTLLHSAACVINDICDRDIDGLVGKSRCMVQRRARLLIRCRAHEEQATCHWGHFAQGCLVPPRSVDVCCVVFALVYQSKSVS
jgi:heme O synthase-like polyprenyltransferase